MFCLFCFLAGLGLGYIITRHWFQRQQWGVYQCRCEICTDTWVAVAPLDIETLTCPNCGSHDVTTSPSDSTADNQLD